MVSRLCDLMIDNPHRQIYFLNINILVDERNILIDEVEKIY